MMRRRLTGTFDAHVLYESAQFEFEKYYLSNRSRNQAQTKRMLKGFQIDYTTSVILKVFDKVTGKLVSMHGGVCTEPVCMAGPHTNNSPTPTDLIEIPTAEKRFCFGVNQKLVSVGPCAIIAKESEPRRPIFEMFSSYFQNLLIICFFSKSDYADPCSTYGSTAV